MIIKDEGYVLSAKKYGEKALIVTLLTKSKGKIAGFVSEYDREESYHLGRVRYFYDLLQTPTTELDPVTLDPPGLWLHDGHHRYAAYVLAKRAWIPATVLRGHLDPKIRLRP